MAALLTTSFLCSAVQTPPPVELAKSPLDVITTTASSFATVGGFGLVLTAFTESKKRSGVTGKARTAVPRFVVQESIKQARRWGQVSAGFAGGRAAGQLWSGCDGMTAAMCGAVGAGVLAASSVREIPSSVTTFVAFSYFIEKMTNKAGLETQQGNVGAAGRQAGGSVHASPTPGQRLDR